MFGIGTSELGGIAGFCENGIIRNSSSSCTVFGRGGIGGLIGTNSGTITNCSAYGYVCGDDCIGGFVGSNSGSITDCFAFGEVDTIGDSSVGVGGFAGCNSNIINNCYAKGHVWSLGQYSGSTGGLVGENDGGSISSCFSTGDVSGEIEVGGLVGSNSGTISNCFSAGNLIASYWHGGLAGDNTGSITNCYSIAVVKVWEDQYEELSDYAGGLVALNYGSIENSYFLSGSGRHNGLGKPLTSRQMKKQSSFKTWDFVGETVNGSNDIWMMFEDVDYPKLAWTFDGNCPIAVTKCTVKDGYKGDSISVSGLMSATDDDFDNADEIVVIFSAAPLGVLIPVCTQYFPINEDTYNDGSFSGLIMERIDWSSISTESMKSAVSTSSISSANPRSHFDYSVKTHKFKVTVKNADLTGMCSPVSMSIQVGSYSVGTEIDETIVNGKRPIPINLLMGVKNSLRVDKSKFTRDHKTGNITQAVIKGGFSVENINNVNLTTNTFDVTVGSQTFTIPKGKFIANKKGDRFSCARILLPDGEVAAATFDFNKCTFALTIKGMKITDAAGDADFKLEFGSFIEGADVLLP